MRESKELRKIAEDDLSRFNKETEKENLKKVLSVENSQGQERFPLYKIILPTAITLAAGIMLVVFFAGIVDFSKFGTPQHSENGMGGTVEATDGFDNETSEKIDVEYEMSNVEALNSELSFLELSLDESATVEKHYKGENALFYTVSNCPENKTLKLNICPDGTYDCAFSQNAYEKHKTISGLTVDYSETLVTQDNNVLITVTGAIKTEREQVFFTYNLTINFESGYAPESLDVLIPIVSTVNIKN